MPVIFEPTQVNKSIEEINARFGELTDKAASRSFEVPPYVFLESGWDFLDDEKNDPRDPEYLGHWIRSSASLISFWSNQIKQYTDQNPHYRHGERPDRLNGMPMSLGDASMNVEMHDNGLGYELITDRRDSRYRDELRIVVTTHAAEDFHIFQVNMDSIDTAVTEQGYQRGFALEFSRGRISSFRKIRDYSETEEVSIIGSGRHITFAA